MLSFLWRGWSVLKMGGKFVGGLPFTWQLALVIALVVGWRELQHHRREANLEANLARAIATYQQERSHALELAAALSQMTANRDTLTEEVRRQNEAISGLQTAMKAREAAAQIEAIRALNRGRLEAASLRAPTTTVPPGHAAMNTWLAEHFGGP